MKKNKKSKKWMWIVGIGILAVVIAFQFLGNQNKLAENTKTYVIKQGDISLVSLSTGKITSSDQDNIKLSGTVSDVKVKLGDLVKKGDLLMCMTDMKSNVALLGHTALMDEDNKYILNQRVGLIRTLDKEKMNYPYLFILTNSKGFIENLRSRANSGVQVNLSTKEIKESLLVMPQKEILEKFNCITENIFEEYFNLGKENSFLTSLRDSLLPKLMSGEIRVPLDEEGDVS